jgi:hypothetical protein
MAAEFCLFPVEKLRDNVARHRRDARCAGRVRFLSYAMVYSDTASREGLVEAIRRRHT